MPHTSSMSASELAIALVQKWEEHREWFRAGPTERTASLSEQIEGIAHAIETATGCVAGPPLALCVRCHEPIHEYWNLDVTSQSVFHKDCRYHAVCHPPTLQQATGQDHAHL